MKLAFITACVYPSTEPIHLLMESAAYFGIDLQPYGIGTVYGAWVDTKITKLLKRLYRLQAEGDYTHVLYTDGRDSLFAANEKTIVRRYEAMGSPLCLMSAEHNCYPFPELSAHFQHTGTPYRCPCAGQFMGSLGWIIEHWQWMADHYTVNELGDNDQGWICRAIVEDQMYGLALDSQCQVFQNMNVDSGWPRTGCVLHWSGGYTDPVTGKDELMKPTWEEIRK